MPQSRYSRFDFHLLHMPIWRILFIPVITDSFRLSPHHICRKQRRWTRHRSAVIVRAQKRYVPVKANSVTSIELVAVEAILGVYINIFCKRQMICIKAAMNIFAIVFSNYLTNRV
jgi:hypothetical protein